MVNLDQISSDIGIIPSLAESKIDPILNRLDLLERPERMLMESYYIHHMSMRTLAGLMGCTEKTVSKRLKNISLRLASRRYIQILRQRNSYGKLDREIAYDHFLLNLGYRRIARKRQISGYQVRKRIEEMESQLGPKKRQA